MWLYLAIGVGILAVVYINIPLPPLTPTMLAWRNGGNFFKFGNHNIFYRVERGSNTVGGVLLIFHGFPTSSHDWIKVLPGLQKQHSQVILFDMIGYGLSDKPFDHDYSIMEQADIAEELLKKLKITQVHFLSHDYGDTVALEMLARFHQKRTDLKILSLCLSNGGIFPETNFPRPTQRILTIPYLGAILCRLSFYRAFRRGFGEVFGVHTQPTEAEFRDFHAATWNNHGYLITYKLLGYLAERSQHKKRWVGALQEATIPVHMIYGPSDPVNPSVFIDHYKKTVPRHGITVLSPDISHYPQWEAPEEFTQAYTGFHQQLPK
ncbi:mesoderm-specific transcript homolog protein-like [Ostrea edulis]|uniref:mesoderm-specific transcript homolog protein-like n=1 Tax=Ostrea edulis TaxID=37623 RepID=UPI002095FEFC|nr:mesoderm-specific transcript homolog protein-like [Ostrea edulis]